MLPFFKWRTALLLMSYWPELSHIVHSRVRRLRNVGCVWGGALCVLGKIRSSVTLEEGKNIFGGPLAGSLVVTLNLLRR